jgi:ABC-type glycerol-3-phosphate transport system substrate-binding protein
MTTKSITLSLLLAIALGMSACGGGGNSTPQVNPKGGENNQTVDTAAPEFSQTLATEYSLEEENSLEVATIRVSDEGTVTFSLDGEDKDYFELANTRVR